MNEGQQLRLRRLPDGVREAAIVQSIDGRVVQLDLQAESGDCSAGAPVELEREDALFLGTIEHREGKRVRIFLEHMLDRQTLLRIQALWKEAARQA